MSDISSNLALDVERRIQQAFASSFPVRTRHIAVTVRGHRVVLRGSVGFWPDRKLAERVAAATPGVWAVDNELALLVRGAVSA